MNNKNKLLKFSTLVLSLCFLSSCSSNTVDSRYFDITFTPSNSSITSTGCQFYWTDDNSSTTNSITTIDNPITKDTINVKNSNEGFFAKYTSSIDYKYEYITLPINFTNSEADLTYNSFYVEVNYHSEVVTNISFPSEKISVGYSSNSVTTIEKISTTEEITYEKEVDASTYKNALKDKTNIASLNVDYFCSYQDYQDYLKYSITRSEFESKVKPVYKITYYKDGYSSSDKPKTTITYQSKTTTLHYLLVTTI